MSNGTGSNYTIQAAGTYRLWAVPVGREHYVSILVNDVDTGLGAVSQVGPFSDAKTEIDMDLSEGDEMTTRPGNAHLIIRSLPDLTKVYDSAG